MTKLKIKTGDTVKVMAGDHKGEEGKVIKIFIDKNLVEVFMNDRQAAAVTNEHIRENPNITLFTKDKDLKIKQINAWKMKSIYEK